MFVLCTFPLFLPEWKRLFSVFIECCILHGWGFCSRSRLQGLWFSANLNKSNGLPIMRGMGKFVIRCDGSKIAFAKPKSHKTHAANWVPEVSRKQECESGWGIYFKTFRSSDRPFWSEEKTIMISKKKIQSHSPMKTLWWPLCPPSRGSSVLLICASFSAVCF